MASSRYLNATLLALVLGAIGAGSGLAQGQPGTPQSPASGSGTPAVTAKLPVVATPPVAAPTATEVKTDVPKEWVVAEGESFVKISRKTGIPVSRLQALNPKVAKRGVYPGDHLVLDGPVSKDAVAKANPKKPATKRYEPAEKPDSTTVPSPSFQSVVAPPVAVSVPSKPHVPVVELEDQESVVREMRYVKEIIHNPDSVPEINCHLRTVHTLILPDGERIVNVQAGDVKLWGIIPIVGKNIIYIKAVMAQKTTNMVVATSAGNLYSFRLTSDMSRAPLYTLRVLPPETDEDALGSMSGVGVSSPVAGINYGGPGGATMDFAEAQKVLRESTDEAARRAREDEQAKAKARERALVESVMKDRNDSYKISYDWRTPFRVQNIFSASGVTYIRVNVPENRQPLLYVIDDNGKRAMANQQPSNVDPNLIIVDQTFRKAVLILDKKEAHITNVGLEKAIKDAGKKGF